MTVRKIAVLLCLAVIVALLTPSVSYAHKRTLARGITLGGFRVHGHVVHYLKVDLKRHELHPLTRTSSFPIMHATPPAIAARHHMIAATNGDFRTNSFVDGNLRVIDVPHGLYMTKADLWGTGVGHAPAFLEGRGRAWIGRPAWNLHAAVGHHSIRILSVNHPSPAAEYTPRGVKVPYTAPTQGRCYAKLEVHKARSSWYNHGRARLTPFVVRHARCSTKAPTPSRGTVVLERKLPWPFKPGRHGHLKLGFPHPYVHTIVSGLTLIVSHGKVVVGNPGSKDCSKYPCPDGYYGNKCPRTALGVKGHYAYIVVVDGKPANKAGIRLKPLALIMRRHFDVVSAVNLDGGGSSVLWARRYGVVSKPSYGRVRSVMMSIGVR